MGLPLPTPILRIIAPFEGFVSKAEGRSDAVIPLKGLNVELFAIVCGYAERGC